MEAAAAHMLNFSQPFDCELLDQIVAIAMDGSHPQRLAANEFLVRMKDHPDMWKRADAILETSKKEETQYFGLQVLSEAINTHWKVIPEDDRFGIRSYIITKIVGLASSDESMKRNHSFLNHLNLVLVQILKQDWPHNWPTFISDLVESSKTSESLCENNMRILKLLSEDVFEFSKESLTAAKMKAMKESMYGEFFLVYQLCEFVLGASSKASLINATLQTLQRFLSWMPPVFIFETSLLQGLVNVFLPNPDFRTATLDCLVEIASLQLADLSEAYRTMLPQLLAMFINVMQGIIPLTVNLRAAYENGSDDEQLFVSRLGLFLGTFLKSFLPVFEQPDCSLANESTVVDALRYMIQVSEVDDEEIFKTCLEFWYHFAKDLYTVDLALKTSPNGGLPGAPRASAKHVVYEGTILHALRIVMIDRMAKPEEVIIVEDENGEIVREQTKDTEVIAQYKTMREALVYLTHLNYEDTEAIMLEKLEQQVSGGMFTWNGLNTLCWAIGSISGAMTELDEKRFLVCVIKDLLRLCEDQRGKDNKAVVASNIMYIVGQYPRFLRAHWKFLKTVVNKLFEFMHELHPGVQDMACDTFLKIAQKCKRKFMTPQQPEDLQPFVLTLISDLTRHTNDLQPHQVQSFYESVATMLSDQGPAIFLPRDQVMFRLMETSTAVWQGHMQRAAATQAASLRESDTLRELSRILKINAKVCSAAGAVYLHQLGLLFRDMLNVYRFCGEQVVAAVAAQGPIAVRHAQVKLLRGLKGDILDVLTAAVEICAENVEQGATGHELFLAQFMPGILDEVLRDYQQSPPAAREAKVLSFFAAAIGTLKDLVSKDIPRIMDAVFERTLEIITKNMEDHPEHRGAFFTFLRQANAHCFYGLFSIPAPHQKMVVESIIWAVKHTERNISETGLEILKELLENVASNQSVAQSFYATFLVSLIQDILAVLTDRLHKSGFRLQAEILQHLCHLAPRNQLQVPLQAGLDNSAFLRDHISTILLQAFPNLGRNNVAAFVHGLFNVALDINAFKQHLRDFLIAVKEFAGEDNSDLFLEELEAERAARLRAEEEYQASVPGLRRPQDVDFDPDL